MCNQNAITTKRMQNKALAQKIYSTDYSTVTDKYEIIVLYQKQ